MAFGGSSSKQQSTQQSTSQQELDPQIKAALLGNYAHAQSLDTPFKPYTGQLTAPLSPLQHQAEGQVQNIISSGLGNSALNSALSTTNGIAGYKPTSVNPSAYTGGTLGAVQQDIAHTGQAAQSGAYNPTSAAQSQAAQIDPNAVQNISAPNVGADQINAFMNPYTDSVVNTSLADLERQRQIQQTYNNSQASNAGAWGGSGNAILASQTNDAALRAEAAQSAQLRSAGFSTALSAAQQQAAQQLAASQSNQSTNLQAGTANAGFSQQTGLANQAATNQNAQFNAQNQLQNNQFNAGQSNTMTQANMQALNAAAAQNSAQSLEGGLANLNSSNTANQFNAQAAQNASLANQSAGLQGAGLNLAAGQQQAAISAQQVAQALGLANATNTLGQQQQQTQQAADSANLAQYQAGQNWPLQLQQLLNQSLGLAGNPVLGQSQSTGSSTGTSHAFNFGLPISFGGGASGASGASGGGG